MDKKRRIRTTKVENEKESRKKGKERTRGVDKRVAEKNRRIKIWLKMRMAREDLGKGG